MENTLPYENFWMGCKTKGKRSPEIPAKEHTNMATMISLTGAQLNNPRVMEAFQEVMNAWQDEMILEMQRLSQELNISNECAMHVQYLRSRSRWTAEKERELISLYAQGNPPKLGEF